jgi:type I restriction enzyme S subunit
MSDYWIDEAEDQLTAAGVHQASRVVPAGTVLILTRGMTLHKRVPICRVKQPSAFNQDVKAVLPKAPIDPRFLPYLLTGNHDRIHALVDSAGHGTGRINTPELLSLRVWIPTLGEQRAIGELGEAVDARIDILRQTNATLEAIAQALFKSWFVDFDPVRAKADGRDPEGMDSEAAALFPASLEEWSSTFLEHRVQTLVDSGALVVGDGYRAKNAELGSPGVAFLRAGDLLAGRISPTRDLLSLEALPAAKGKHAHQGDTVFTSKGTIGRFAYVAALLETVVYSPQVCYWRSLDHIRIAPEYLHFWMRSPLFSVQVDRVRGNAAIMDFVSLGDQRSMALHLPSESLQAQFAELVRPMLERASVNRAAIDSLTGVRDSLLPRLISGKLRLSEAEALITEVAR